ncbi:cell envelope integrity protein CreD [Usitatibacter palustris]|uniref:Inner membrane protein CreD n=1 Tax=Usitatibacter palustris TaxID=2732487 RepID=A0A6M4H2M8_9PROT|nr:cell envelope integrity protein CreD [Usitatibacter palustris]QJR13799.1 Inner membrane protein CreD [Usitatibacter palustris]
MRFPLLARAVTIGAVALAVLLPLALVGNKVSERQARATSVATEFARESSSLQTVVGPLLALQCEETVVVERLVKRDGKDHTLREPVTRDCATHYFPPRTLAITGRVPVETLHRGIYPIRLYRASLAFAGEFEWPAKPLQEGSVSRTWTAASVMFLTSDARGLRNVTPLTWGEGTKTFVPSETHFSLESKLGDYEKARTAEPVSFRFSLDLYGTKSLNVAPVGDATTLRLTSDWPHPSFIGAFAPDERRVTAEGFEAAWKTTHFATGGRPTWQPTFENGKLRFAERFAGFALADPVNVYSLSYRATEYGFLFVLFTFAGLALAEAIAGVRLHLVQYALVGSALAIFFLLLIALAEHIAFELAYLSAATACVALLTFYLRHPLGMWGRTGVFFGLFVTLYGALFGLLRSEDHALLAGSLLVFGVLAVGMLATRRLDWGMLAARLRAPTAGATVAP